MTHQQLGSRNTALRIVFQTLIFGSVMMLCGTEMLSAQSWQVINPNPTANNLRAAAIVKSNIAIVAGDAGSVFMSNDKGVTWNSAVLDTYETPFKIVTTDENIWWIIGTGGLIAKTVDAGRHWQVVMHNRMITSIDDAYFPDADHGVILGQETVQDGMYVSLVNFIRRTDDGGLTWSTTVLGDGGWKSISFTDADNGWMAGVQGYIVHTTDRGATWELKPRPWAKGLREIKFFDPRRGVCWNSSFDGTENRTNVFVTADSGKTWQSVVDTAGYVQDAAFYSESNFLLCTGREIRRTTDGGKTWTRSVVSNDEGVYDVAMDSTYAIAVGEFGHIWQSTDGLQTWQTTFSGPRQVLRAMATTDSTYWIVGGGSAWFNHTMGTILLSSTDRGEHWVMRDAPTTDLLYTISFIDAKTGWIGGSNGKIFKTTDAGNAWTQQPLPTTATIKKVQFLDADHGWALSSNREIFYTTDGGASWKNGTITQQVFSLYDLCMADMEHGCAVGADQTLVRTTDGGATWNPVSIPVTFHFISINFLNQTKGFITTDGGHILRTTDAGSTWYPLGFSADKTLRSITFTGADTGFAVGDMGAFAMTTDGGNTWQTRNSGTTSGLMHVTTAKDGVVWSVGENGSILRWGSQVWKEIDYVADEAAVPQSALLLQNYPNPFNPSTTITYAIPRNCFVTIKIYDILGREVSALVNELMPAGRHSVSFNAHGLPSGIYIYRIQAGAYADAKRMLLIK